MASWDNVALPGPPNGPAYINAGLNAFNTIGQGVNNAFKAYQDQANFAYQQGLRNLFQNGVPTNQQGNPDYVAMMKPFLQAGGAGAMQQIMPLLLQQSANQQANSIANGSPLGTNTANIGPSASTNGTAPQGIDPNYGRQQSPADSPYNTREQVLSSGMSNTGTASLDELAASRHIDLHDFLAATPYYVKYVGKNLNSTQEQAAAKAMDTYAGTTDEIAANRSQGTASRHGGPNPVPPSGTGDEPPPSSSVSGMPPMTPRQTGERRAVQAAQTAQTSPSEYQAPSPRDIANYEMAGRMQIQASKTPGLSAEQARGYQDEGNRLLEIAKQMREERARFNEPTTTLKEYNAGKRPGESLTQFQARQAAEKTAADKEAADAAAQMKTFYNDGLEAKGHLEMLDDVRRLGRNVPYGVIPKIQSKLGEYGFETKGLGDIQAYEAAINYMAPQLRPIGSGRLMQQELTAFKSSLGGLMRVPEGREIALDNLELLANYKAKIGEIAGNRGLSINDRMDQIYHLKPPHLKTMQEVPGATGASGPKEGDRKQFKQGWGVFRGGQWVPASP